MPLDYNLPSKIDRAARDNDEYLLDDAFVSETEITQITFIKNSALIVQLLEALGELTLLILTETLAYIVAPLGHVLMLIADA